MIQDRSLCSNELMTELAVLRQRVAELEDDLANSRVGEEALKESEEKFRVIFDNLRDGILLADKESNMTMPGMTGKELATELLAIRPDIPIILCTGFSEFITEEKARAIEIRGFAMKPLSLRNIAELIRKALDKKEV
jgi:FixJ family two-component response regulator